MDANRRDSLKDRSWMNYKNANDRRKPEYVDGVNAFLDFAFSNAGYNEKIRCPCVSCYLGSFHDRKVVFYHLLARGIINDYNPWTQHGEDENEDESIPSEIHMPIITYEEHPSNPCIEHNVSGSHEEIVAGGGIHQGEKENRDVHQETDEDGGGDSPVISPHGPNVGKYVNDIGTLNTDAGGDVHQENDDEDGDDDYGDQDVSVGEDDNFIGVHNCDSSPNQSCDDADVAATEDEQVAADGYPLETAQETNAGNRKQSNARRRGPRGLKWKKEMEKSSERVKVELPAKLGRVVGSNARQFVVEASWLLKQTLPPNVKKWKDLNPNDVAKLLEKVKSRFIFPDESHVDPALLWQFKQWYRAWRSDLRRVYFNKYETYEEQLANCPPYIKEVQWKWLVDYWSSEKFKNLSAINSKVRSSQTTISCVGPTTIARLAYELEMNQSQPDSDQSPVYLKLFEKQKRRNDGTWVDKEAEDGYTKLVKLHKNQVKDNGIDNLSPSEAYAKVFGKAKSINLIGLGENPIALGGSGSKWKRTSCSDQRIIEATVRARVETQSEKKLDDEEALIEQTQSDRQLHTKMREQIRLIRKGLESSSNPRIKHNVRGSHEEKVGGGDIHQGEKENRDVLQENNEASIEQTESDRQLRTKMREQIRLIREGLVSSSANPRIEHNVRGSHEEKAGSEDIHQGEKEDRDVHQENNEDGGGDSPVIPSNVWKYINAIGMSKTDAGGDAHQGNDGDDDNGDQAVSIGEDDNFVSVNSEYPDCDEVIEGTSCFQLETSFAPVTDCDSSPNGSCDDAEAEQVAADGYSSEAAPAPNSGDRNQSNVRRREPCGLKWKKEMEKSSERVKVELPAKVGRVVGSNARQFVVEAGWLLKQTLPPNAVKWKDLNPNDVAKLLEKVKNRFIFPDESHVDAALLWQFKQWYRAWRSDLRRVYFNKYETYEEQLANRPPYIKEDQWKWLVDYWSSEKFKNLSSINSKVRNNQPAIACVGQMSIARLAYELEMNQSHQPDSDQSPVYLKLFEKQKKRNDGTWVDKEAEDGYTKLLNLHKKQIEDHGIDNLTPSEAYAKVFSKARSINLLGLGENPIALRGSSSKRKRKGCFDESVIEATLRARIESQSEQKKSNDDDEEEAQIEKMPQSDRELRAKMREQIRLIRQGLASSSSNA